MQVCIVDAIASQQQARFKVPTRLNSTLKLANQPKYELASSFLCLLGRVTFNDVKPKKDSNLIAFGFYCSEYFFMKLLTFYPTFDTLSNIITNFL